MLNNQNIQGGKFLADLQYLLYLVWSHQFIYHAMVVQFLLPSFLMGL